jgi:hypothetical protein
MEKLVSDRFYYFMVIYTLIIVGALSAATRVLATTICVFGCVICLLMTIALCRVGQKLKVILSILHRTDNHPVRIVGRIHRSRYDRALADVKHDDYIFANAGDAFDQGHNPYGFSNQDIIAFAIPAFSTLFLAILSVLFYNGLNIITTIQH